MTHYWRLGELSWNDDTLATVANTTSGEQCAGTYSYDALLMDRGIKSERLQFACLAKPSITFAIQQIFAEAPGLLFGEIGEPQADHQTLLKWLKAVVSAAMQLARGTSSEADDIEPVSLWTGDAGSATRRSSVWRATASRIRAETQIAFWKQYLCLLEPSAERETHNWGAVAPTFLIVPLVSQKVGYLEERFAIIAGPYHKADCGDVRRWFRAARRREHLPVVR